jgi:RNA 3'-terminal phosphate cyclase (ATP)
MPGPARGELLIDGSRGEGGGQILRTAMSLSAITGRPLRIENIRAGRPKPGLAAQHLTAIRSAAAVCAANVSGATLGSMAIRFEPASAPIAGNYRFDVAEARAGGSAGAATLVLQTVAMPAAFAQGLSRFRILGGTHITSSPTFDYVREVWLPLLNRIGVRIEAELKAFGFYPVGGGEIEARVEGAAPGSAARLKPVSLMERGRLLSISGRAIAANLPAHVPQRMADRARTLLDGTAPRLDIEPLSVRAACPGAALFLSADYEHIRVGFNSLGARGKSSEAVAEEAAGALVSHMRSGAAMEPHLADQMLLPLALAAGPSAFTCEAVTRHLKTNAWVIEQFGVARVLIEARADASAHIIVTPQQARFVPG